MNSQILASTVFTGNAGGPASVTSRNCVVARTGAGVYTITLGTGIDSTQLEARVVLTSATNGTTWRLVDTSDTVKTLNVFSIAGNAATDTFSVAMSFSRVGGG